MEIIKLIYISHPASDGLVEMFSSHRGWQVAASGILPANLYMAVGQSPNLLLVDLMKIY